MTAHINAKPGEIAENVLLVGDPLRAQRIADEYFTDAVCVNTVRNMLAFTGDYQGQKLTVFSVGMGMPSMGIYATELVQDYGAKQLIRLGTTGAMQKEIAIGDVILAMSACTDSNINNRQFGEINFTPIADYDLLAKAYSAAEGKAKVGAILTTDTYYVPVKAERDFLLAHNILSVDMETAMLYTIAMRHKIKALSILTVSDHLITGEATPPEVREQKFHDMAKLGFACITD